MALKKISLPVTSNDSGKRLDQFLFEQMQRYIPKGLSAKQALSSGNQGNARASQSSDSTRNRSSTEPTSLVSTGHEEKVESANAERDDSLSPSQSLGISKAKIRKLIVAGAVYLNRKRVRIASKTLIGGAQVEVFTDWDRLFSDAAAQQQVFAFTPQQILFEDATLIAVDKPPGIPTQPTLDEARDNVFAALKRYLFSRESSGSTHSLSSAAPHESDSQEKSSLRDAGYLALHHRLDRDTSGVLLFSKSKEVNAGLADQFKTHRIQKIYVALVSCPPGKKIPSSWEVRNFLAKKKLGGKKNQFGSVRSGGDSAHTSFRVLERFAGGALVEARPTTGRTHQIRVHLSESGFPIFGDTTYGGALQHGSVKIPRTMLHAACLTFEHPLYHNEIVVQSVHPGDFIECFRALSRDRRGS